MAAFKGDKLMPLPELTTHGLLPVGTHDASIDEIAEVFARFQKSDKRMKLMDRLKEFLKAAWAVDDGIQVYIDGSFLMQTVDEPSDIDIVLVLPATWDFGAELPPFKYNVLSKRMVRRLYRFDILVGIEGHASSAEALDFFRQVHVKWAEPLAIPVGTSKGIIRVLR